MRQIQIAVIVGLISVFTSEARGQPELPLGENGMIAEPPGRSASPPAVPPAVAAPPSPSPTYRMVPQHERHPEVVGSTYRSPGLAAILSLTPVPIDFGSFYVDNVAWGITYTAVEVPLMIPTAWFVGRHMDEGSFADRGWTGEERTGMMGLMAGYIAVKLISGLHTASGARHFNQRAAQGWSALEVPASGGAVTSCRHEFRHAWPGNLDVHLDGGGLDGRMLIDRRPSIQR